MSDEERSAIILKSKIMKLIETNVHLILTDNKSLNLFFRFYKNRNNRNFRRSSRYMVRLFRRRNI